jgi:MFS family permease
MGPLLGGFLVAKSFSSIFIVNGLSNTIAAIIIFIGLRSYSKKRSHISTRLTFMQTASFLKQDKTLRIFLLGLLPVMMVFFQHEASLAVFLTQNLRFSYHFYGFLFTINTLMIVFFEILLNVATSEWRSRTSFIIGSILISLGFMGFAWATQAWQVIVLAIIWTLGEMILFPAASAFVADIALEKNRGAYMGLFSMNQNAALLLGLWGGSLALSYFGPQILWIICGFWGLLSLIFFLKLPLPFNEK